MNTFKKMMVGLVGAGFLIGAMAPVLAAPVMSTAPAAKNENVQHVRDDRWRRGSRHGHWRGHRPGPRPGWHGRPYRPGPGYWNGYRGDRYYRHGYRRHNDGWWYPLAAFGAGAIIGGAIAAPPPPVYRAPAYGYSNSHVQWCYNRYRSYRASDNTFQPYNGPRQQCYSPY
ncbi:BA14K family protein [Brucella oryzae]|uniref:Lectin-like protein BA14k n=1 Tax=Brucella oryzae TaxID=335286 RepID=A0A2S7IW95_9HYPH|nr:BA14K family protein [Brucella oryzae]MBR7651812.1 BA14K family protein [Brucella oryzae]PQA72273.1 BA14K family protein [Brucella oryzae]